MLSFNQRFEIIDQKVPQTRSEDGRGGRTDAMEGQETVHGAGEKKREGGRIREGWEQWSGM